jgi:hypothetical protein
MGPVGSGKVILLFSLSFDILTFSLTWTFT